MTERRARRLLSASLRPLLPLAAVWAVASVFLGALAAQRVIPYEQLVLDPNAYGDIEWYTGLVSNLGILGWTSATVVAATGGWLAGQAGRPGARALLRGGALYSSLLLLDDLFQLHVVVTHALGTPKAAFYAGYVVLGCWWAWTNAGELSRTRWPLAAAAVAALSLSVVVDQGVPPGSVALVAEDSCKFLGIVAWSLYFVLTGRDIALSVLTPPPAQMSHPTLVGPGADRYGQP
ncbi:MAG: hypothetical protein R2761_04890 [Acidimicrobiales bacterium]